jgi:hypothetical protein
VPFARKMKSLGLGAKLKVTHTSSTYWHKMQILTFLPNALNNWERFDMLITSRSNHVPFFIEKCCGGIQVMKWTIKITFLWLLSESWRSAGVPVRLGHEMDALAAPYENKHKKNVWKHSAMHEGKRVRSTEIG